MADAKKYYWLRLKKDFFKEKEIKKLRRIAGGDTYTIIYLKMQLLSLADEGKLYFEGVEDAFYKELALELDEEEENVKITILYLEQMGLLEFISADEYFLTRVPELIGSETDKAELMRKTRNKRKTLLEDSNNVTNVLPTVTECYTEKEKEKEKKKEKEKDIEKKELPFYVDSADAHSTNVKYTKDCFEMLCVEDLINSCLKLYPDSKVPKTHSEKVTWAYEIDKMQRLDKRSNDEIKRALLFAINDKFWKSNIRSTKKFREKFETLIIQSKTKSNKTSVEDYAKDLEDWANG